LIQPNSALLAMTSDISTVRHIESAVRERANCARDPQEHYPISVNGCPVAWRMEMLERLGTLNVCIFQPVVPMPSKQPQRDFGPGGILKAGSIEQHVQRSTDAELLTPATTSTLPEHDGQSDESNFLAPPRSLSSCDRALHRLISGPLPQGELAPLIETVFSSREAIGLASCLRESDAQTFIHEVHFRSSIHEEWTD